MKLRSRLALTLALLVVPFAVGLGALQTWQRREAVQEGIAETVRTRMRHGERQVCEDDPERWPQWGRGRKGPARARRRPLGPKPGPRRGRGAGAVFAYDAELRSRNPQAPELGTDLRRQLARGEEVAAQWRGGVGSVAVRMPWDEGPCAVVLVQRPVRGTGLRALLRSLWPSLVVSLLAVLLAVLAAGPIVRRVRRLTEQVQRVGREEGAGEGSEQPVEVGGRDEIAELARAFEASRREVRSRLRQLRERDAALTRYVANTTHDVMLPLTVLQGHLTTIRQRIESSTPVDRHLVDFALEESHYLTALLHNMSAAAKLEAGERVPQRHPVDLSAVVHRVVARHEPIARHKEVELNHAVPESAPWVEAEPTLLEQAVSNLVHNAIRHNERGGHVAIVLEPDGDEALLRVIDDGPGLSDERLEELAGGRFTDPSARNRTRELGLGLQIAREVADRHGFGLRFERSEAGGLAVELRMPSSTPSPR